MSICPDCKEGKLYPFKDHGSEFIVHICWKCGHYESNSPTYRDNPEFFRNIVRNDPFYYLRKGFEASKQTPKLNTKNYDDENPSNLPVLDIKFW